MKAPQDTGRIFWMVRLLVAVGLTTIVVFIGLAGLQINAIHTERVNLQQEQARLYQTSEEILRRAGAARAEIIAVLDDKSLAGKSGEANSLAEMVARLLDSTNNPFAPAELKQLASLTDRLAEVERQALGWRANYDPVWQDFREQRTMGQVRDSITVLRGAVETLAGRRRLQEAVQFKHWRATNGEAAAQLAQNILTEQSRQQNQGAGDLERELAELESLVELLGGEEQLDNLPDLKDNELTPSLDRLRHDIAQFVESQPDNGVLTTQAVEELTASLFGQGYTKDQAHQTIRLGTGGLYALRQDILLLRSQREQLDVERSTLSHDIDALVGTFIKSAQTQSESLAEQVDQKLASSWRRMMVTGFGCSTLFVWLAWLISRAIQGQVNVIARAKTEAESGRQTAQLLMLNLQKLQRNHELVLNAIGEGIHWINSEGEFVFENPVSARLLGWENTELLGRSAHATVHHKRADGSPFPQCECPIDATLRTGLSQRIVDEVFWRKDGTSVPVEYMTTPVRDEEGRIIGAVVVFTDITKRKRADAELAELHRQLLATSRQAGMAEVASNILHNIGNVLNSVNVSASLITDSVKNSKTVSLAKVVALLREHEPDLGTFIASDPRGRQLPDYLAQLSEHLLTDQLGTIQELDSLRENIEHIKEIVTMQQSYAKVSGVKETVDVCDLVEDSLRMNVNSFHHPGMEIIREFGPVPPLKAEKHKILQILVNLVRNAQDACEESGRPDPRLTLRVAGGEGCVRISVSDNGVGISPENLTRIFNHGFTTKTNGHGFGLHSGALAAREMGGALTVHSDGPGQGSTFTLELPDI